MTKTRYLISYDVSDENNYEPLWTVLKGLGAIPVLRSQWVVRSELSADQLVLRVAAPLGLDDKVLVSRLDDGTFEGWELSVDLDKV